MTKQTVLITGCSSGFGKLTAETFSQNGWNVIATMRSPGREKDLQEPENILATRLDVTDVDSVNHAVNEGLTRFGRIDVAVNNAGYGGHALFEQASDESIRAMFETNVFGSMNVMRAVLPLMRRQGAGTIINVTSMAGLIGLPGNSVYSASKFALEGLSEGMALEYKPFNIRVHIVEPGAYPTTRFGENIENQIDVGDKQLMTFSKQLSEHFVGLAEQMAAQGGTAADAQEVADKIYKCATLESAPVHNPTGADSEMLMGMMTTAGSRQEFLEQMETMLLPRQS